MTISDEVTAAALAGPAASASVLVMRGVSKGFAGKQVLDGLDLCVQPGQIVALLGANGAGKTTAVRILSTLMSADAGGVSVAGHDVATAAARVREVLSLTGQFAAVDEVLTGRENVRLVAQLRHQPDPARVAADLLDRFDLADAADRRAGTYSGGMRRRLDIAMSLVGRPRLLVLDEPTTGLDPQARARVWDLVRGVAGDGAGVLLTTQYLEEAEQLADRIAILAGGRIIAEGTLAELKALFPPARREYVERQPTLEEIFLAITGAHSAAAGSALEVTR